MLNLLRSFNVGVGWVGLVSVPLETSNCGGGGQIDYANFGWYRQGMHSLYSNFWCVVIDVVIGWVVYKWGCLWLLGRLNRLWSWTELEWCCLFHFGYLRFVEVYNCVGNRRNKGKRANKCRCWTRKLDFLFIRAVRCCDCSSGFRVSSSLGPVVVPVSMYCGGPIIKANKTDAIRIELTITFQVKLRLTNRNTFGREIILFEQLITHAV